MTPTRLVIGLILFLILNFWEGWVRLLSGIIRPLKNNQTSKTRSIEHPSTENNIWEDAYSSNIDWVDLPSFENINGEGIVSFQPSLFNENLNGEEVVSSQPVLFKDPGFYSYLLVNGEQIFEYGSPCGTCGIIFRKIGSQENRVSDPEAVQLLGDLNEVPSDKTLHRLARILEPGTYHPIVIEGNIQYIKPGTP
ncbi:MAG TPA: hypothetical protein VLA32_10110, partial [Anaerolineales bacterium]|nr:hypothetical protein [Anaerolineales bacterium]